jgi:ABC-type lipoprotein export system ATPase subunit
MSALLSLQGVGKRYRRGDTARWLLRDVTLELAAGEALAVVAMRSQGKTTLLRIAAGMLAADEGRVLLGRTDVQRLSDAGLARLLREQIGWAGREGPRVGIRMQDYVAMRLALGGRRRRREVHALARLTLRRLGVEDCAERRWEELSDWERVLVELAQALAGAPQLVLVDDVLDGLGMRETEEIGALLRGLARELGVAILMSASDVEAALSCDRVLSLAGGRVIPMSGVQPVAANVIDIAHRERSQLPRRPRRRARE